MDDILIDAQTLATFSNLQTPNVEEFRHSVAPDFLPQDFWGAGGGQLLTIRDGAASAEVVWQSVQRDLQEVWAKRFPLDGSIQLITSIDKWSKTSQALARATGLSNQEVLGTEWPVQEVWPFQRAVMFLTVNSWRARFCPACGKRFVAAKPKSTYCSDVCFKESRKGTKRAWWGAHGEDWRDGKQKAGKKQSKKGR